MEMLFCKAMHIIGVVAWFAGLFYIVRLFAYHVESREREEPARTILHEQFTLMEARLWKVIMIPGMIITLLFGIRVAMLFLAPLPSILDAPWLLAKLGFVVLLVGYHHICGRIRRQLAAGTCRWTSPQLRLWNELATLLLVAIVMLVIFKSLFDALWGGISLVAFGIVLALAVRVMRNRWSKPQGMAR
jgi:putative membrane protein